MATMPPGAIKEKPTAVSVPTATTVVAEAAAVQEAEMVLAMAPERVPAQEVAVAAVMEVATDAVTVLVMNWQAAKRSTNPNRPIPVMKKEPW